MHACWHMRMLIHVPEHAYIHCAGMSHFSSRDAAATDEADRNADWKDCDQVRRTQRLLTVRTGHGGPLERPASRSWRETG